MVSKVRGKKKVGWAGSESPGKERAADEEGRTICKQETPLSGGDRIGVAQEGPTWALGLCSNGELCRREEGTGDGKTNGKKKAQRWAIPRGITTNDNFSSRQNAAKGPAKQHNKWAGRLKRLEPSGCCWILPEAHRPPQTSRNRLTALAGFGRPLIDTEY